MGKWNLEQLYSSLKAEEYLKDLKRMELLLEEYEKFSETNITNRELYIEKYLSYSNKINELLDLLHIYPKLLLRVDQDNTAAESAIIFLDTFFSRVSELDMKHVKIISKFEDLDRLLRSNKLSAFQDILEYKIDSLRYSLEPSAEKAIFEFKNSGSYAWYKLRNNLVTNFKITTQEGMEYSLADFRKLFEKSNKEKQIEYYFLEKKSYDFINESCCAALTNIKKQINTEAKMRGFKNPLEMIIYTHKMSKSCLDAMMGPMPKLVEAFEKYNIRKAKILKRKEPLALHEIYMTTCKSEFDIEFSQAKELIVEVFNECNSELGEFAKKTFLDNWIDSEPSCDKLQGSYCSIIPQIGQSRISMHYNNDVDSLCDLAHEIGHGFHGECLIGEKYLNTDYPIPIAETVSLLCESLISSKLYLLLGENITEKRYLLERDINNIMITLLDNLCFYYLEKELFEKIELQSFTPEMLCDIMEKFQKNVYAQGVNPCYLDTYGWIKKIHCYFPDYYYYNFPYIFGHLLANGLLEKLEKDVLQFSDLKTLLRNSGKLNITKLTSDINIDICTEEFWNDSTMRVVNKIEEYLLFTEELL